MNYLLYLFPLIIFFQPLLSYSYMDSLDLIIDQTSSMLAQQKPHSVKYIVDKIDNALQRKSSLSDLNKLLSHKEMSQLFLSDGACWSSAEPGADSFIDFQKSFKELKIAVVAKIYLYCLFLCEKNMMDKAAENYDSLKYWELERFYQAKPWYRKHVWRWTYSSRYQDLIQDNIHQLNIISSQTNYCLGLVRHSQQMLSMVQTAEEFQQVFAAAMKTFNPFLENNKPSLEEDDLYALVVNFVDKVDAFSFDLLTGYELSQPPSHLERHWQSYALTTTTLCACALIYCNYKNQIEQGSQYFIDQHIKHPMKKASDIFAGLGKAPKLAHVSIEKEQKLLQELVKAELGKSGALGEETILAQAVVQQLDTLTDGEFSQLYEKVKNRAQEVDTIIKKVLPIVEKVEEKITVVERFQEKVKDVVPANPFTWTWGMAGEPLGSNISVKPVDNKQDLEEVSLADKITFSELNEAIRQNISTVAKPIDFSKLSFEEQSEIVFEKDCKILSYPEKNMLNLLSAYHRIAIGGALDMKQELNAFVDQANNFVEEAYTDNRLILGFAAFIPVVTLVGSGLFASKTVFDSISYRPIQAIIRDLNICLNQSIYKSIDFDVEGNLYFLTETLKTLIPVLMMPDSKMMEDDIAELQSMNLSYQQKFNVMQRMHNTYSFLLPGAV